MSQLCNLAINWKQQRHCPQRTKSHGLCQKASAPTPTPLAPMKLAAPHKAKRLLFMARTHKDRAI